MIRNTQCPRLPLATEGSSSPLAGSDRAKAAQNHAAPIILLVEDNPSDVYVITRALKQSGIRIDLEVVSDGEQALAILENTAGPRYSLVLLDWNLPRISGAEVLAHARRSERWSNVPVIVVTSSNSPGDVNEIWKLGATAYFRKPTHLEAYLDLEKIVLDHLPKPAGSSEP